MNFWEIVDSELEYKNIDRKELALKAGFNVSNISKGIRENNIPSVDTAYKIASILGVSVEYLVTGIPSQNNDNDLSSEIQLFHKYRKLLNEIDKLKTNEKEGIELLVNKLSKQ